MFAERVKRGWPEGTGRVILPEADSTNAEARRRAPELYDPTWILALRQTQGRGRRGRPWADPEGNFSATLVLQPREAANLVALRSFVAALALWEASVELTGKPDAFALKWPNDVLLNRGKLAGILLEAGSAGASVSYLAIGIGVNLSSAPEQENLAENAVRPVSLASELGVRISPEEFLDVLAPIYANWEETFSARGFSPIRDAWLERAARRDEEVTARTMREEIKGIFRDIDLSGNLVLETDMGLRSIAAAEVYF